MSVLPPGPARPGVRLTDQVLAGHLQQALRLATQRGLLLVRQVQGGTLHRERGGVGEGGVSRVKVGIS